MTHHARRPVIEPAGLPAIAIAAVPAVAAALTGRHRLALGLATLPAAVAAFFRDPDRPVDSRPAAERDVLSPADGRVMHAGEPQLGVAPPGDWLQVAIFLSALDVHINRSPAAGVVRAVSYKPGRWLAAYSAESATENESSEITLAVPVGDEERPLVFRQIVGLLARRVVTRVQPGQQVRAGERIGLMKFGSRMDVFVPRDCTLEVRTGDRVVGGETVIARWGASGTTPLGQRR
ncbi:MAG: phosphatidylserine decarboxylase [Intrasporangiaceae bacterium]|nr:phosphatidylserine decarboxylase [Intrasporangiaceae bacterium]